VDFEREPSARPRPVFLSMETGSGSPDAELWTQGGSTPGE